MSGLSSIFAMVIVTLIVISMVAFFYTWSIVMFNTITNPVQATVNNTLSEIERNIIIVTSTNTTEDITVFVKNVGTNDIDLSYMTAYLDDSRVGFDC